MKRRTFLTTIAAGLACLGIGRKAAAEPVLDGATTLNTTTWYGVPYTHNACWLWNPETRSWQLTHPVEVVYYCEGKPLATYNGKTWFQSRPNGVISSN